MPKRVKRYRVTSTVMATLTGLVGEIIVNLTNNSAHVHDGTTPGGFELARADADNIQQATSVVDGKMSAAQVIALSTTIPASVTANGVLIAANTAAALLKLDEISATNNRVPLWATGGATLVDSDLAGNGTYTAGSKIDAFPTGATGRMLFWSSTTPPGWTINAAINDYAMKLSSSSGGSVGGASTFSSKFNSTVTPAAVTLSAAQSGRPGFTPAGTITILGGSSGLGATSKPAASNGSGSNVTSIAFNMAAVPAVNAASSHNHTFNLNVLYMNVIRGEKA